LVASHEPLTVELGGTLLVRLFCFLLPALLFLAFDCVLPQASKSIKAHGRRHLPLTLGRRKLIEVTLVAISNVLLSIALQAVLEYLSTQVLHTRSLLRVTVTVPLPWTLLKDVVKGLAVRAVLRYTIHRYLLHTYQTPLKSWHLTWQHSVALPFSLVAAYDHPFNYLASQWIPAFFPACFFRFHVLAWHLLLAIGSLEDLFVYSGYAVLPSGIVLPGMARRTEAHFASVKANKSVGNFGHLGLLDLMCGTTCSDEVDLVDDFQSEAEKHRLQERAEDAVQGAIDGIRGERQSGDLDEDDTAQGDDVDDRQDEGHDGSATAGERQDANAESDEDGAADQNADESTAEPPKQRRSGRRKARKA
jgi:hypothetical protein